MGSISQSVHAVGIFEQFMQYFMTLGQPLVEERYVTQKKRKERENNRTVFCMQCPRAARALSLDQNLKPNE